MTASEDSPARSHTDLTALWDRRHADPEGLAQGLAALPEDLSEPAQSHRHVLEAFTAWRAADLTTALTHIEAAIGSGALDARWTIYALDVQGNALVDLGLTADGIQRHYEALALAHEIGDAFEQARAIHDIGVALGLSNGRQALAHLRQAIALLRPLPRGDDDHGRLVMALTASAALNVLGEIASLDATGSLLPEDIHDDDLPIDEAERLAVRSMPQLAASICGERVLDALDSGDLDTAHALLQTLPDPASMRDSHLAASLVQVRARVDLAEGRPEQALSALRAAMGRTPERHRLPLVEAIVDVLEHEGRYREALAEARALTALVDRLHAADAASKVQALEVWHRTERAVADAQRAVDAADRLRASLVEAEAERRDLRRLSTLDPLTHLANRRGLEIAAATLPEDALHQVAILDIDAFKGVNDRWGHAIGDDLLRKVARAVRAASRPGDTIARLGGDEFVVLRPRHVGQHPLVDDLTTLTYEDDGTTDLPPPRLSIGVSWVCGAHLDEALDRADALMYAVKRSGGDGVQAEPAP